MFNPDSVSGTKCTDAECVGICKGIRVNPAEAKHVQPEPKFAVSIVDFGLKNHGFIIKNLEPYTSPNLRSKDRVWKNKKNRQTNVVFNHLLPVPTFVNQTYQINLQ